MILQTSNLCLWVILVAQKNHLMNLDCHWKLLMIQFHILGKDLLLMMQLTNSTPNLQSNVDSQSAVIAQKEKMELEKDSQDVILCATVLATPQLKTQMIVNLKGIGSPPGVGVKHL
uniref:Uncharacterized protein n=1 Tax=Rhizophora mucronata TaxID=61149 RepID=A0A2P2JKT5_RHIMU